MPTARSVSRTQVSRRQRLVIAGSALALLAAGLATAWVGEDALITYRTIDNWVNGHGLRFNVDERVQTYTHPLWMFLNAGLYWFTREIFWTTTIVGLACSLGAFLVLARRHRERPIVVLGVVLLPWLTSLSLMTYSTSGFENPLTYLLLALFGSVLCGWQGHEPPPWTRLTLIASLGATNRLDTILLYLPALLWLVVSQRRRLRPGAILLGGLPLAAWFTFSVVYYGFPFPNTAPAKVSAAVPASVYFWQGIRYTRNLLENDLVGTVLLLAGMVVGLLALERWARGTSTLEDRKLAVLGAGLLLYVGYVIRVGGGFLTGRFFAAPIFVALIVLAERLPAAIDLLRRSAVRRRLGVAASIAVVVLGLYGAGRMSAARGVDTGILPVPKARATLEPNGRWKLSARARVYRESGIETWRQIAKGRRVFVHDALGFTGVAAGPNVLLIDQLGLADPLLARLKPRGRFYIGHLWRQVPEGYVHARETGSLDRMEPRLRAYYERLRLIVAGPIFSAKRFATIAEFSLGRVEPPEDL